MWSHCPRPPFLHPPHRNEWMAELRRDVNMFRLADGVCVEWRRRVVERKDWCKNGRRCQSIVLHCGKIFANDVVHVNDLIKSIYHVHHFSMHSPTCTSTLSLSGVGATRSAPIWSGWFIFGFPVDNRRCWRISTIIGSRTNNGQWSIDRTASNGQE